MEILEFIFRSFWTFIGAFLIIGGLVKGLIVIIRGYPPLQYTDEDLIAIYKIGRMDKKNDYHMSDDQILSEIKTLLKHGSKTSSTKQ